MSAQKCGHLISKIFADISRRSHKCTDIFKEYGHILKGIDGTRQKKDERSEILAPVYI